MKEIFAHLHVHSDFTLAKGASKIKSIVEAAKAGNIPAIAMVDEGNMYGAMEFSMAAVGKGIQPIIGVKLWFDNGLNTKGSIVLLAQNEKGYENICHILAQSHRPREGNEGGTAIIPVEIISGNTEGIIALTGGIDGCIRTLLENGRDDDAEQLLNWLRFEFCDRIYLEITRFGDETAKDIEIEEKLINLAYDATEFECSDGIIRNSVPLVGTSEVWYAEKNRHDAFEILNAVSNKSVVNIEGGVVTARSNRRYHIRSIEEMKVLFSDIPEAFENAGAIAKRCAFKTDGRKPILPPFQTQGGRSEGDEMRVQAHEGLKQRLASVGMAEGFSEQQYVDRLEYELGIIEGMEFPGYFLIVSDFIKWAKANGIPVGPGRGSGAGSLVAYSLKITDLDPLRWGLLFERFLNPERVSMPDFDVDFCQDRRGEVIQYVREKYGDDYVSMIATFGEIKSRTAIKDVGRVLNSDEHGTYSYPEVDALTKIIPKKGPEPKPLAEAMTDENDHGFRILVNSSEKNRLLIQKSMQVEGLYRTQGTHAAGVIITGRPMDSLVPVGWDSQSSMPVCQFNMKHAEKSGLVKFDFLGLKTLSVIRECLENIENTTGEKIDLEQIDLSCQQTYSMLAEGYTNGVFQFESDGMKKWFRALKPSRFEDLIALVSLYRPGPMDMIPHFVDCKNGKATPNYPEPADQTKLFLEETFGIMVYQEQVMLVAQVVAGYSLGGADMLRRAMGKKVQAEMDAQRKTFIDGAVAKGTPAETANELFDTIDKFAGYGFNKSHAAAYALIAYQTAWLKKHYPAQFMAALLTYEDKPEKMAKIKEDMDAFGIKMLMPSIDLSGARFKPEKYKNGFGIRFGLAAINGISNDLTILEQARKDGPFKNLTDFHSRAGTQFNKGQLERLVEAGAFDGPQFAKNRFSAARILAWLSKGGKKANTAQADLFGGKLEIVIPKELNDSVEWGNRIDREFNAVGFYFGEHPLDTYEARLKKVKVKRKASLSRWMQENNKASLKNKRLAGLVEAIERKQTRNGDPFITARIAEKNDHFYVRFFMNDDDAEHLDKIRVALESAKVSRRPVIVVANLSIRSDGGDRDDMAIWGNDVLDADEILVNERGKIRVKIDAEHIIPSMDEQKKIRDIKDKLSNGTASASDVDTVILEMRNAAINRKMANLSKMLERVRADENDNATQIILTTIINNVMSDHLLEGSYVVDLSVETAIKATDGVVSVGEAV